MNSSFKTSLIVWFVVMVSIRLFGLLNSMPFIYDNMGTIAAVLLVYPPVLVSIYYRSQIQYWKLDQATIKSTLFYFAIVCVLVFPGTFLGNHFYQKLIYGKEFHSGESSIWMMYTLTQLILVAFPEEFFFRGYLQTEFQKRFPTENRIFGIQFGRGLIYLSLLFAISHSLITLQWWHIFIFFPALVFSWLKEKTGAIWASMLFHFVCNMFAYWILLHYG